MAAYSPQDRDAQELDRWYEPPGADFADPWSDPDEARAREVRQVRRYQFGFVVMGFGLLVASLFNVGALLSLVLDLRPLRMGIIAWEFAEQTAVVWLTAVGAGLLWGHWPDASWRRRSGLMLMMFLADLVLWSADHAVRLGLSDAPIGHEHFRTAVGHVLGWAEFLLMGSLAAGMSSFLGEVRARDLGRAVRSLTIVGAAVWLAYFLLKTDWTPPIWPLRERPWNRDLLLLFLGSAFLSATILVQVTLLTFFAATTCNRVVRALAAEGPAEDPFPSRSEHGWEEFQARRDRDHR